MWPDQRFALSLSAVIMRDQSKSHIDQARTTNQIRFVQEEQESRLHEPPAVHDGVPNWRFSPFSQIKSGKADLVNLPVSASSNLGVPESS